MANSKYPTPHAKLTELSKYPGLLGRLCQMMAIPRKAEVLNFLQGLEPGQRRALMKVGLYFDVTAELYEVAALAAVELAKIRKRQFNL